MKSITSVTGVISSANADRTQSKQFVLPQPTRRNLKYCMSHLGWVSLNSIGLCSLCGSAMVEDEDMT